MVISNPDDTRKRKKENENENIKDTPPKDSGGRLPHHRPASPGPAQGESERAPNLRHRPVRTITLGIRHRGTHGSPARTSPGCWCPVSWAPVPFEGAPSSRLLEGALEHSLELPSMSEGGRHEGVPSARDLFCLTTHTRERYLLVVPLLPWWLESGSLVCPRVGFLTRCRCPGTQTNQPPLVRENMWPESPQEATVRAKGERVLRAGPRVCCSFCFFCYRCCGRTCCWSARVSVKSCCCGLVGQGDERK